MALTNTVRKVAVRDRETHQPIRIVELSDGEVVALGINECIDWSLEPREGWPLNEPMPAMGQPSNAEIMAEIRDWRAAAVRARSAGEVRLDESKRKNDKTRADVAAILARLETLEAAFGIASSKSAEWFDRIWRRLDLLSGMVAATSWRPTKPRRKGKKKG